MKRDTLELLLAMVYPGGIYVNSLREREEIETIPMGDVDVLPFFVEMALEKEAKPTFGLYLHFPFCKRLCRFCMFFSVLLPRGGWGREESVAYANLCLLQLRKELREAYEAYKKGKGSSVFVLMREGEPSLSFDEFVEKVRPRVFHCGGGTPNFFHPDALALFYQGVQEIWPGVLSAPDLSFEFEMSPDVPIPDGLFDVLEKFGVTRLSVGVQTFNPDVARFLRGREPDLFEANLEKVLSQGWAREVNMDLLFDLPYLSLEESLEDVRKAFKILAGLRGRKLASVVVGRYNYLTAFWKQRYTLETSTSFQQVRAFLEALMDQVDEEGLFLRGADVFMGGRVYNYRPLDVGDESVREKIKRGTYEAQYGSVYHGFSFGVGWGALSYGTDVFSNFSMTLADWAQRVTSETEPVLMTAMYPEKDLDRLHAVWARNMWYNKTFTSRELEALPGVGGLELAQRLAEAGFYTVEGGVFRLPVDVQILYQYLISPLFYPYEEAMRLGARHFLYGALASRDRGWMGREKFLERMDAIADAAVRVRKTLLS